MLSFAIDSVIERQDGFGGRGPDSIMKYSLAEQSHFDRRERIRCAMWRYANRRK